MYKLDTIDIDLIQLLERDARQPSHVLAKQLNVSPASVRRRIRKLLRERILRIGAVVNPDNIGMSIIALLALDVAGEKIKSVLNALARQQHIVWLASTTGRFDVMALAWFGSPAELSSFIEQELTSLDGIRNSETFICLRVAKSARGFID